MRIGIDTRALLLPLTGIGRYTQQLLLNLEKVKRPGDRVIYFWGAGYPETEGMIDAVGSLKHTHNVGIRGVQGLWEQVVLPRKIRSHSLDVYHSPRNYNMPYYSANRAPVVVTMHDIIPFLFSEQYPYSKLVQLRWRLAVQCADRIITVSQNSKKDLMELFAIPEDQIVVAYCGVDERFRPMELSADRLWELKQRYGLTKPYILTTGGTEPIKNSRMLMEVMKTGVQRYPEFSEVQLAVVGPPWPGEEFPSDMPENIRFTGFVADDDLPLLMAGAELFVFPTLYEGFGIPPLEAMASGTAVIASNAAAVPEVVGDAGILIEPTDQNAWLEAIYRLQVNDNLRREFAARGPARAARFSWLGMAETIYATYEAVCAI